MNKVYAIIGPPASGKTSLVKELSKQGVPVMVSHTTRPKKQHEVHGADYYFVSKEEFGQLQLIEKVTRDNNFYGLSKDEVLRKVNQHPVSIVDIDLVGLEQLKKLLGGRVESIFVLVDKNTVIQRLVTQNAKLEDIQRQVEQAAGKGEFDNWQTADYVVKNTGAMDASVRQMQAIMGLLWAEPASATETV
ncbi:guanylate kinase [Acetonema longum]|uniref:Guanylate kinase n=1 Tax=Acetonema longum DSM 6540 TaxID=1009370 RepID=F7NH32_9FIRM|nr:guanylate kinase [Acetonema longum]EGO64763.1 guanylate kinase [Acetonema longum DSM 6540]